MNKNSIMVYISILCGIIGLHSIFLILDFNFAFNILQNIHHANRWAITRLIMLSIVLIGTATGFISFKRGRRLGLIGLILNILGILTTSVTFIAGF